MKFSARQIRFAVLLLIVAVISAVVGGLFQVCLHLFLYLIIGEVTPSEFGEVVESMPLSLRLVLPIIGGLFVGFLAYVTKTPEVYGEGVRRVREAVERGDGLLRLRVLPLKFVATLATLASGGSAGREGPMVMMGAGVGSMVGQWGAEHRRDRDRLLLSGVAATVAAAFGAPLAAVVLVVELLRRSIDRGALLCVAVTSTFSFFISRYGFGLPGLNLTSIDYVPMRTVGDLFYAVFFGLFAAIVALAVVYGTKTVRRICVEVPLPDFLMPALGGLFVGILWCLTPYLHEASLLPWLAVGSTVPILVMIMVLVLKIAATCITLGSGGSGGIFAPSLFLGAVLATACIALAQLVGITILPLYILVAMAGVLAGVTHMPLTAALLVLEASGHLTILPLLLIASYVSFGVIKVLRTPSLYSESDTIGK